MDEHAYLKFVPNEEPGKIYSFLFRKCFIVIYSHKYVNLLQIIIKYIKIKRQDGFFKTIEMIPLCPDSKCTWRREFPMVDSSETWI